MKVWFITGTSRGFGRVWAQAALARGDKVAATARDVKTLAPLSERYGERVAAIALDVTDRAAVFRAVAEAQQRFGRLDVAINNAGYGLFGAIEEISEANARAQIETNLFGALWVTQAVLPIMRAQGAGHILQVSSIGGVSAFPTVGMYHASKWGLEGFSQSLAQEVAPLGIKVTQVVDAAEPPLRIFLGTTGLPMARAEFAKRLQVWEQWNDVSVAAQGDLAAKRGP
jgi:NAD(P)-dependent dehydrogenase (short-subunit alcohol dehydrogenase family)